MSAKEMNMHLCFSGWGSAVPDCQLQQEEALKLASLLCAQTREQLTWLPNLYNHTGIKTRRIVLDRNVIEDIFAQTETTQSPFIPRGIPNETGPTTAQRMEHYQRLGPPLVLKASRNAMEAASIRPESLTHLVTVTCTGFFSPGFDYHLIANLGLQAGISRTQVGFMGCHGSLNGLRVAHAFVNSNPEAKVLLSSLELCSLHYHYGWDPQKIVANSLFADGAASVIVEAPKKDSAIQWKLALSGSFILPNSADAMTWEIGNHGFDMTLGKQVPGLIQKHLKPWLDQWLEQAGLIFGDVKSWALHPGGPKILQAIEEALGLPPEASFYSRQILAEFGNMSSATLLFILKLMAQQNAPRPCVALGFGPGLAVEAALFL